MRQGFSHCPAAGCTAADVVINMPALQNRAIFAFARAPLNAASPLKSKLVLHDENTITRQSRDGRGL